MTSTLTAPTRNVALTTGRVVAGVLGAMQLGGMAYFLVIDRSATIWHGPLVDLPIIALLAAGVVLKLGFALWPGLTAARRISLGLAAVGIGIVVTLIKIPLYDEPEGVTLLAFDAVLLTVLLIARRADL